MWWPALLDGAQVVAKSFTSRSFVNKIPPDYVQRTLSRLLPPAEELVSMNRDQLLEVHRRAEELKKLITLDPVRFYQPNPGGQWDFMTLDDPTIRVLLFIAGNKTGKTTGGAVKMAEYMCGRLLWGHAWRKPSPFKVPSYGCVFAEDFDSHKEVTLPAYLSWCPKKDIKDVKRNPAGSVVHIEHYNGSFLFFRTYDQGSDRAEGKDWNAVWCDEPPPRSIYTAVLRGLVTLNGILLITATLLKETWLFDEAEEHDFIKMFGSTIYDNPWLSDSAREDFVATLSDDERAVRVSGKPISLTGLIFKEFRDGAPYVIPDQEFQPDWPIILCVDPHERKPSYLMWGVLTPSNSIVFFEWALIGGDLPLMKAQIDAIESTHNRPAALIVIDPNRGRAKQINEMSWEQVYNDWGYSTLLGLDDIRLGHTMVHTYLLHKTTSGDHSPRIRFTERCRGKGGPVYSMLRYAWDDWAVGKVRVQTVKDVKEKPRDTYKDFPDLVRYCAMAELDFDTLKYGPRVIDRMATAGRRELYRMGVRAGL